jgi:hypothetical protein
MKGSSGGNVWGDRRYGSAYTPVCGLVFPEEKKKLNNRENEYI